MCYKYEFINKLTGVSAQSIELFNSEFKPKKRRKGILTDCRVDFFKGNLVLF